MMRIKNALNLCILAITFGCTAGSDDFIISFDRIRYIVESTKVIKTEKGLIFSHDVQKLTFKPCEDRKQKLESCSGFYVLGGDGQVRPDMVFFLHDARVNSVAFSHNEKFIASAGIGKKIKIWSIQTQSFINEIECQSSILLLAFCYDDKRIIALHDDKTVRIWNVDSKQCLLLEDNIVKVAFSSDGKWCACVHGLYHVRLWNIETGTMVNRFNVSVCVPSYNEIPSHAVALSSDGNLLVSADEYYKDLYLYSRGNLMGVFNSLPQYKFQDLNHTATALTFSSDDKYIVSNHNDGRTILWNTKHPGDLCIFDDGNGFYGLPTYGSSITACSPKEGLVISCHKYRTDQSYTKKNQAGIIKIWNLNTNISYDYPEAKLLQEVVELGHTYALSIAANSTGSLVAVALSKTDAQPDRE